MLTLKHGRVLYASCFRQGLQQRSKANEILFRLTHRVNVL